VSVAILDWKGASLVTDPFDAWQAWCRRMSDIADVLRGAVSPDDALARAEGVRYLARMTALGLLQATDFSDPDFPALERLNDDVVKWGGPNVDNVYLAAPVRHPHVYRLDGSMADSGGFILQTITGFWGEPGFRVHDDRGSESFTPEPDGRVTIIIGGRKRPGNWMPLHPAADRIFIREYAIDWQRHRRCDFVLERVGGTPLQQPVLDVRAATRRLEQAAHWVEHTVTYWNRFETEMRNRLEPNTFSDPFTTPAGGSDIRYGNGRIELDEEHVLLIELEQPDARYWSVQLYNDHWYESLDFGSRCTSRNNTQVYVDEDGVVRLVAATRDPGVPNWLDLAGHHRAFAHFRAVWCRHATRPRTRVVTYATLRDHLPPAHPGCSPEQRHAELTERRNATARRFRR